MPPFTTRLTDGVERALDHLPLALIPLLTALLNTEKVGAVLTHDGFHVGLRVGNPISVLDLWTFVDPPTQGATVNIGVPFVGFPLALVVIPLGVIIQAGLSAGYLGSIEQALSTGSYTFEANVREFFLPFLLLAVIPLVVFLPLAVLGLGGGAGVLAPLVILLIPLMFLLGYLFYATPYLVVLREMDLLSAARRSYELALDGGPYFTYFIAFMLFVLVVSPFASLLVVNVPIVGLVIGLVGSAVLGLAGNIATMRFVADVDPGSPSLGTWNDGTGTDSGFQSSRSEGDHPDPANDQ